ncbi:heme exporter protein D [Microbulbifer donghaiensis]|uniref:Heme exporter protein D n=1 Tax=Microbulbifer donghaiensis TaxID=494016 RepID=A0A1M5HGP2_9GAMM|nr:heme exporter protein CcmD [Microbulbifer donghaiensis]SHG15110.1 heme exporter protein D [Microbulbifer donghaiensis]
MQFQFASFADFLTMEGHGIYVWISYGVTFALLAALAAFPLLRRRQLQRELQRQQRIQQRRHQAEKERKTVEPA